jgi:hypothetical protein
MPAWESFSTIKILLEKSRKIKNNIDNYYSELIIKKIPFKNFLI